MVDRYHQMSGRKDRRRSDDALYYDDEPSQPPRTSEEGEEFGYRTRQRPSRYRSRSRSPPPTGSRRAMKSTYEDSDEEYQIEESTTVILKNLPRECDESKIVDRLLEIGVSFDRVTVIKDRRTHLCRGFAFITFPSIALSSMFVREHAHDMDMQGQKVWIQFAPGTNSSSPSNSGKDWTCPHCRAINYAHRKACFRCSTDHQETDLNEQGGAKDIGDLPCQFLVIQDLPVGGRVSTPRQGFEIVQDALRAGDKKDHLEKDLVRFLLVRERGGASSRKAHLGYGFAEFTSVNSATRALDHLQKIGPFQAHYINPGIFIPLQVGESPEFAFVANNKMQMVYWNKRTFVDVFTDTERVAKSQPLHNSAPPAINNNNNKKRKSDHNTVHVINNSAPRALSGQLQQWQEKSAELHNHPTIDEYSDPLRLSCILCQRRFNSIDDLNIHTVNSKLHTANLYTPATRESAHKIMAKIKLRNTTTKQDNYVST